MKTTPSLNLELQHDLGLERRLEKCLKPYLLAVHPYPLPNLISKMISSNNQIYSLFSLNYMTEICTIIFPDITPTHYPQLG